MNGALRSSIAVVGLGAALSLGGLAAAVIAAAPQATTRVIPPAESASIASSAIGISHDAFDCDCLFADRAPLPEDAAIVDGSALARSTNHTKPRVWKPP